MLRKLLFVAFALAACGGVRHTKVSKPTAQEVNSQELARIGRITSVRENGGTLFVGAEKGIAAVDPSGKVLWSVELPSAMARLVEADSNGIAFTSFNDDGVDQAGAVKRFLIGNIGDEPHFKDQTVGAATREGKLLFTGPAATGVTQMSRPGLTEDQIAVSRGKGFFIYSRADGHEIGRTVLLNDFLLGDGFILNASFNQPAHLNGAWYASHLNSFLKTDDKAQEKDRTGRWGVLSPFSDLSIGPIVFKDRLICGHSPIEAAGKEKSSVIAFDKEGGKDWRDNLDDKESGVAGITANSESLFVATNFHVTALNEKGSEKWDQKNNKGGLFPGKYSGLRFYRNTGARKSQGQLILADEKNVYVATKLRGDSDALTVLNAKSGEYVGSLDLGTFVADMALLGDKIALATDDGLKLVPAL